MSDGTVKDVAVATINKAAASTVVSATEPIAKQGLYTYNVNEDGSYALSAKVANDVTGIVQNTAALTLPSGATMYTNTATKYYVVNWVADTKTTADDAANA
jgi:hypothetical protein